MAPPAHPRLPADPAPEDDLESLEAQLGADPLYEMPDGLASRILAGLPEREDRARPEPRREARPVLRLHPALRAAAAVLAAFVAWFAATGTLPRAAVAAPPVREALRPAQGLLPSLPTLETPAVLTGHPTLALAAGIVLLILGIALARRVLASDRRCA